MSYEALSIRPSVGPSVGPSVVRSVTLELKMRKTRIYDTAVVTLCVGVCLCMGGELGVGLG